MSSRSILGVILSWLVLGVRYTIYSRFTYGGHRPITDATYVRLSFRYPICCSVPGRFKGQTLHSLIHVKLWKGLAKCVNFSCHILDPRRSGKWEYGKNISWVKHSRISSGGLILIITFRLCCSHDQPFSLQAIGYLYGFRSSCYVVDRHFVCWLLLGHANDVSVNGLSVFTIHNVSHARWASNRLKCVLINHTKPQFRWELT